MKAAPVAKKEKAPVKSEIKEVEKIVTAPEVVATEITPSEKPKRARTIKKVIISDDTTTVQPDLFASKPESKPVIETMSVFSSIGTNWSLLFLPSTSTILFF